MHGIAMRCLTSVLHVSRGMISKNFLTNLSACRELFFSKDLPAHDLERFQALLREHASKVPVIDVSEAPCVLLTIATSFDTLCTPPWWIRNRQGWCMLQVSRMKSEVPLAAPPQNHPAAFVLGADEDLIVDVQAVEETAALYHVQPHILQNSAHDVMLVRSIALFQISLCRTHCCARSAEAR